MLVDELAKEVHQNAIAHGWWEEERSIPEIIALIHSEWSEALEEARKERPLAYTVLHHPESPVNSAPYVEFAIRNAEGHYITDEGVICDEGKPEGIAVELIDGVIRILDFLGHAEAKTMENDGDRPASIESLYLEIGPQAGCGMYDLPSAVAYLHYFTSEALKSEPFDFAPLVMAMTLALSWVNSEGIDPLALLLEKHRFNKGRPYKHGKKF